MSPQQQPNVSACLAESIDYLSKHLPELQQQFAGQWVALAGQTVRFSNDRLDTLQEEVETKCPHDTLLIDYVPLPGELLDWK
jgi:hypothetical protein